MTKKITDEDIKAVAKEYDLAEALIRTVLEVESRGSGFDHKGRVVILFEPHVFYRNIEDTRRRDRAVQAGLAYRVWGTMPYVKDSYTRFNPAFSIDPIAAMKACSWGLGQILGENHVAAGFPDVGSMVDSFKISEANQLRGMMNFIKANKLDVHLRKKDWRAFAKGYNGPGYEKNAYHTKLEKAHDKWSKQK